MVGVREGHRWQPDEEVKECPLCERRFTLLFRRHHCRKCGRVVCGYCSDNYTKYLPNTPIATPGGQRKVLQRNMTYRTCGECLEEIRMIRQALFENGTHLDANDRDLLDTERAIGTGGNEQFNGNANNTKYSSSIVIRGMNSSSTSVVNVRQGNGRAARDDDSSEDGLCPICAVNLLDMYLKANHAHAVKDGDDYERFKETHVNDCLVAYDFTLDHHGTSSPENVKTRSHTRNKMLVYNIPPIPKPKFEMIPRGKMNSSDSLAANSPTSDLPNNLSVASGNSCSTMNVNEKVTQMSLTIMNV